MKKKRGRCSYVYNTEAAVWTLCLRIPALPWLYGSMDSQAGHFRRYTTSEVNSKLVKAGFNPLKVYYFNVFGVLPWLISARVLQRSLQSGSVNLQIQIFNALIPALRMLEHVVPMPVGQSVMAIATVK